MKRSRMYISCMALGASILAVGVAAEPLATGATNRQIARRQFHPLVPLPTVRIVASSEAYPGGRYEAIKSLTCDGIDVDLVDSAEGLGLNDYFYVAERDPKEPKRNGAVRIEPGDTGPLTGELLVYSDDVPGCRRLLRTIRLIDGIDRVDLNNSVEKEKVLEKEAVHFGFAFNVPEGVMRMDMPWSVVRPEPRRQNALHPPLQRGRPAGRGESDLERSSTQADDVQYF